MGAQQLVEVARALVSNARVIVFDEPTSSLAERDAQRLFEIIERLRQRGLAIVYISHFLEEVRQIAQTYTVLRDGRAVAAGRACAIRISRRSSPTWWVASWTSCFPRSRTRRASRSWSWTNSRGRQDQSAGHAVRASRRDPGYRRAGRRRANHLVADRFRARADRVWDRSSVQHIERSARDRRESGSPKVSAS